MSVARPTGLRRALESLTAADGDDEAVQQAAWVARCVGRGAAAPLAHGDINALAGYLRTRRLERGTVLFRADTPPAGVWIVQKGRVELSVGSGRRRVVVHLLQPGDVDGDIQHLLGMPMPYTARAMDTTTMMDIPVERFEELLHQRPAITRRWLSSVAMRVAAGQDRILGMLGRSMSEQVAHLLLDEAVEGEVPLPQRTLAAMLGVQRPSLNKVLKEFERTGVISVGYSVIELRDAEALACYTR